MAPAADVAIAWPPAYGRACVQGVLNLVNHVELPEFLPELTVEGRAALSSACAEIRRHLSSVVKMCWLLREVSPGGGGGRAQRSRRHPTAWRRGAGPQHKKRPC